MARRRYGFRWFEWEILVFIIYLPFQVISHFLLLCGKVERMEKLPMKVRLLSLPDNLVMAAKSSWRSRERVLAVFAGVFLASLVISTVLAYGVGLSQAFLQYSLQEEIFDAKVDFSEGPGEGAEGRTCCVTGWNRESSARFCDEMAEVVDIGHDGWCSHVHGFKHDRG